MRVTNESSSFTNVLIYVSDALRYDSVPDKLKSGGEPIRTISSGLATPESMSTIVTGLFPSQHQVWRFSQQISSGVPTVFQRFPNAGLHLGYNGDILRETLDATDVPNRLPDQLEQPFVSVVKDDHAHAPYGELLTDENRTFGSFEEYWRKRGSDIDTVRSEYRKGAQLSGERFLSLVDALRRRDILDETLVIFTADHGNSSESTG